MSLFAIPQPPTLIAALVAGMVLAGGARAQESESDASATLLTPLAIITSEAMDFGTLSVSPAGTCGYDITPAGKTSKRGDGRCAFLSGAVFAGRFEVDCGADALVRFSLYYTDLAPEGASFTAPDDPMTIDAVDAGSVFQILPCDSDGRSDVRVGGRLTVTPKAQSGFSGRVGTIRLEIAYD